MAWDLNSDRPIYTQIFEKMQIRIVRGLYQPGERLPSVRDLAAEANVNPNTMQRAFTELERCGLIVTQRNSGRIVTMDTHLIDATRHEIALAQINSFFSNMRELGFTDHEIMELIKSKIFCQSPTV